MIFDRLSRHFESLMLARRHYLIYATVSMQSRFPISMGMTNTFSLATPLLPRPAVFSQTAILSSLIARQLFHCSNDTDG